MLGEAAATVAAYNDLATNIKALANVTEDARVDTLIGLTTGVITAGNTDSLSAEVEISIAGLTTTEYDAIAASESTVILDTITYGRENYSFYDQAACERDVGYILDGLSYDIRYGGNTAMRINAEAYLVGAVLQIGSGELTATVAAYNDLKTRLDAVVSTTPEQTVKDTFIDEIVGVINAGNTTGLDAEVEIGTGGLSTTEFDAIQAAIADAQTATIAYVDANWVNSLSGYDAVKCARDAGLIMDAVRRDLILGTDYNSITAGFAYKRANSAYVLSAQLTPTIQAVNFLRDQIKTLTGPTSDSIIDSLILKVTQVLDGTITTYTTPTYVDTAGATYQTADRIAATNNIQTNRATIVSDLTTWISINYSSFSYDIAKCERDVGYILDALSHDVKYGGNTAARQNAL